MCCMSVNRVFATLYGAAAGLCQEVDMQTLSPDNSLGGEHLFAPTMQCCEEWL